MRWRSVLAGALGLAVLETVLTAGAAQQGQLAALLRVPGEWARKFMDPSVPLVPNFAGGAGAEVTSASSAGSIIADIAPATPPPPSTVPAPQRGRTLQA